MVQLSACYMPEIMVYKGKKQLNFDLRKAASIFDVLKGEHPISYGAAI